jgi:hypothetical protein
LGCPSGWEVFLMGDLLDLTAHPSFQARGPSREELLEQLEIAPEPPVEPGRSICRSCIYFQDRNPWWRKLLGRSLLRSLVCRAAPRAKTQHPVTGKTAFLPFGTGLPANASPEEYEPCFLLNPAGRCKKFEERRHLYI